jgi:pilus assembly protein CpaC
VSPRNSSPRLGSTTSSTRRRNSKFGSDVTSASGKFTFSDFLNIFLFSQKFDIGVVIHALKGKGFLQSLAEPNLIAYNGQEASFLAGGEFPVPVVQGVTAAVSVTFKEFGVRLRFTPTIAGDTIRLKVRPEVSSLDFRQRHHALGLPDSALITRRADTDVELRDGQSFAIAGLLEQPVAGRHGGDSDSEQPADHRLLFKSKADAPSAPS